MKAASSPGRVRRSLSSPWIHPVMFAVYPVVFLWAQNLRDDPPPGTALALALAMVAGALAITAIAWLACRDTRRAAFVGSLSVVSFASFGRVAREVGLAPGGGRETLVLVAWVSLTVALAVAVIRVRRHAEPLTRLLNTIGTLLVFLNLVPIVAHRAPADLELTAAWDLDASSLDPEIAGPERDVYYLIFDRFAGERTLRDLYDEDASAFYQGLRDRGFVVVDDALANYPQTTHSLASSLNLTHLAGFADEVCTSSSDWGPLRASLGDSTLSRTFQALGYRYVHIGSWWSPTWADPAADVNYSYGGLGEFGGVFAATTMWPALGSRLGLGVPNDQSVQQFERVHYQIDKVAETARDQGLTFTFAHFTLPHTPYVFHADGSMVEPGYREPEVAYVDQLRYTETLIQHMVDDLLSVPGPAPIIVVQSDEGPHPPGSDYAGNITWSWPEQSDVELGRKLRILEAIYLPGQSDRSAYSRITPVNTFRMILNDYFGGELERLPDRTYAFADYQHPYRFVDITDRLEPTPASQ